MKQLLTKFFSIIVLMTLFHTGFSQVRNRIYISEAPYYIYWGANYPAQYPWNWNYELTAEQHLDSLGRIISNDGLDWNDYELKLPTPTFNNYPTYFYTYEFDSLGRLSLKSRYTDSSKSSLLSKKQYLYDQQNRVVAIKQLKVNQTFGINNCLEDSIFYSSLGDTLLKECYINGPAGSLKIIKHRTFEYNNDDKIERKREYYIKDLPNGNDSLIEFKTLEYNYNDTISSRISYIEKHHRGIPELNYYVGDWDTLTSEEFVYDSVTEKVTQSFKKKWVNYLGLNTWWVMIAYEYWYDSNNDLIELHYGDLNHGTGFDDWIWFKYVFDYNVTNLQPTEGSKFSIYPNPVIDKFYFNLSNYSGDNIDVKIYNSRGFIVKNEVLNRPENSILVENLTSGLYIYQVQISGSIFQGKLIKK